MIVIRYLPIAPLETVFIITPEKQYANFYLALLLADLHLILSTILPHAKRRMKRCALFR